jgi:hypothetical protein
MIPLARTRRRASVFPYVVLFGPQAIPIRPGNN